MKAAVMHQNLDGHVDIKDVKLRPIHHGEALVKVEYCGLCHTDLHLMSGDFGTSPAGRIFGHEGVGRVIKVADDVKNLKIGDRVAIPWFFKGCGHCEYCVTGHETLCRNALNPGLNVNGAMAQECIVPADYSVKVPEGLDPVEATSLTCAGVTTYKALKVGNTKPGDWVEIVGAGGLGNLAVQYAHNVFNAHVIIVDGNPDKIKAAKDAGAEIAINYHDNHHIGKTIQDKVGGVNVSVVTAVAKEPFTEAVNALRPLGTLVAVALPKGNMELNIDRTVLDGIKVAGSLVGTRHDLAKTLQFGAEGEVKPIVHTCRLSDLNNVIDDMKASKITGRMVVDFTKEK
ncbi:zinc-dependent alcohol dehydrogenase [Philodulcilactobacillus myokoensis]|uniref:Alcohol dehydrogenase n=1 Tax=Philodulcilactobacillus myokoensis TaxID=2929573 RepID=A0A9W6ETZ6_9LACO|nr:alcohol dehydrogenase AdhP [Philodulcilactobacillus myokoensis]GLB47289.1 zinc-dependent alcohol dehydrogenase [Philodulcilactobacillus myokoensis]